jgi:hypothetical protein
MTTLATALMIPRYTIRGIERRFFLGEEIPLFIACICMIAIRSLYIVMTPMIFRLSAVARVEHPLYADMPKDAERTFRIVFATVLPFFSCLWCVKVALLVQCRRLVGRQRTYTIIWWCIVVFAFSS